MTFSPDGQWIAFVDEEQTFKKVRVDGGAPVEIVRNPTIAGSMSWGDDDAITFGTVDPSTGLLRVSAKCGDVEVLTRPDAAQPGVPSGVLPLGIKPPVIPLFVLLLDVMVAIPVWKDSQTEGLPIS